jgi:hypothetical protein
MTGFQVRYGGMLKCIRYDGYGELVKSHIKGRKADTIQADGTFFDKQFCERGRITEAVQPASVQVFYQNTVGGGVDVPLNDVPVQSATQLHAPLKIYPCAWPPACHIGFLQCFLDCCYQVSVAINFFNSQTDAIVSQTLVDFQGFGDGRADRKRRARSIGLCGFHFADGFNNPGKHRMQK